MRRATGRHPPLTYTLARGVLTGGVIGTSLAALVVGPIIGRWPLFVAGLALPAAYGLLLFLAGAPRRAQEAAGAPDDAPAYRVAFTQDVHLADLPDFRRRGVVVVVRYPPDRPWRVEIVKRPTPRWEERAAGVVLLFRADLAH